MDSEKPFDLSQIKSQKSSLSELQYAHETITRQMHVVFRHAYVNDDRQAKAIEHLMKAVMWIESIIQDQLRDARRRRDDAKP